MAWKYQRGGIWWIGYRHNGKQVLRSTGTKDEAEAQKELEKVEMLFGAKRAGSLTEELYHALSGSALSTVTLVGALDEWLAVVKSSNSESTYRRYWLAAGRFKKFLNANEKLPLLRNVTTEDINRFLMAERGRAGASTVNLLRSGISTFFKSCIDSKQLRENPASDAKRFKAQKGEKVRRRSFTLEELQKIYAAAPNDFWRYMIVGGAYTGLRLGDLVKLKWGSVDLRRGFLIVEPDKTGDKVVTIPIAKPFLTVLTSLKAKSGKVHSHDCVWPSEASRHARSKAKSGYFSNQFRDTILVGAGLMTKRVHLKKENSTGMRKLNELSFHCLRHTFVSNLKSNGGSQTVAKALAGHSSDLVNDLYTHVPESDLIKAVAQLPEFV